MTENSFLKTNIQKIAREGEKIYDKIKKQYEPGKNGKFLAIEITSKQIYLGNTSAEALAKARQNHPQKVFYIIKIGFQTAETVAKSFLK